MLLTTATGVFAQEDDWLRLPYRVTIAVDVGIGIPMAPTAFNNLWNTGLPASIAVGYVVIPHVEIQGWLTYSNWGINAISAQREIGIVGVHEITGGTITTLLYGVAAKIYPLPKSRIMPTVTIGGGVFTATAEDLVVGDNLQVNSMEDGDGPVLTVGVGMEYGVNERWNVYTGFKYIWGMSDNFAPANLLLSPGEDPVAGEDLGISIINLGILVKI